MGALSELRRLRAAIEAGRQLSGDQWQLVIELAGAECARAVDKSSTPADRLAARVSGEVDRWMQHRGITTRTLPKGMSRNNLARCLKGRNVTIGTIAEVASALGCEAVVEFLPRPAHILVQTDIYGSTHLRADECGSTMGGDHEIQHHNDAASRSSR